MLGCVLHRGDPDRFDGDTDVLLFCFNRADLAQPIPRGNEGYTHSRFAVSRFALKPRGKILSIHLQLNLAQAALSGEIRTETGLLRIKAWIPATRQALIIEQEAAEGEEPAEIQFRAAPAGVITERGRSDYEESAAYDPHPEAVRDEIDGVSRHRQEIGGDRSYTVGWTKLDRDAASSVFLATLAYSHPVRAEPFEAENLLKTLRQEPLEPLRNEHATWWAEHYRRMTLELPDDPQAERYWWMQQYKIGCLMRPDLQVLDLSGPWYCHTPWRGIWWNYNTQTMYRHLGPGNRCELGEPLLRLLEDNVEQLARNTPDNWKEGALVIGRASSFNCNSPVTMIGNEKEPSKEGREAGNLLWALHSLCWLLGHAGEDDATQSRLAPLLQGAIRFFEPLLEEDAEGRLHLQTTFSPEYKAAPDCHYDLALLRWGCRTYAEIAPDEEFAEFCRDLDHRLVEFPRDSAGRWAIGKGVPYEGGHRHFSHLMAFWPLRLVDRNHAGEWETVEKSLHYWLNNGGLAGWSYAAGAVMQAELGHGDDALPLFRRYLKSLSYSTLYREAGSCMETCFFGLEYLHSALAQSGPGWIHLLPALPSEWKTGSIRGLRCFGGIVLDLEWTEERCAVQFISESARHADLSIRGSAIRQVALEPGQTLQLKQPL